MAATNPSKTKTIFKIINVYNSIASKKKVIEKCCDLEQNYQLHFLHFYTKMESNSIFYIFIQKWNPIPFFTYIWKLNNFIMVNRLIFKEAKHSLTQFRALCITGPRQSGKTTLSKLLFKGKCRLPIFSTV